MKHRKKYICDFKWPYSSAISAKLYTGFTLQYESCQSI